jgi:Nickel responsive protein SCO4226-like
MASRDAEARRTYLVEHYRPGLTVDTFKQWAAQIRATATAMEREGERVRYVRSAIVPGDESLLCVLEAATEEQVRELYSRAGLPFERLSTVIPEGERGWAAVHEARKEES